jgi:hypothetical protein
MGLQTRPTNVRPQTTAQARQAFTSHGPRISTQQCRQLTRGAELYERSEKIKEAERRRKLNAKRKSDKEDREREARRRMGIPSPRAGPKVAASQGLLVDFVRVVARCGKEGHLIPDVGDGYEGIDGADFGDDVLDDDSLLDAVEQKSIPASPDHTTQTKPDDMPAQQVPKYPATKASTSFTGSTDFVLAREITWTQDIDAARSFDSELIRSPTLTPEPQLPVSIVQDCWEDMLCSNTQIEREMAITPRKSVKSMSKNDVALQVTPPADVRTTISADVFLAMLSTQDLTFSSPELDHCSLSPRSEHSQSRQSPAKSPADQKVSSTMPNNAVVPGLMLPPPRPVIKTISSASDAAMPKLPGSAPDVTAKIMMPPPPRPVVKTPIPSRHGAQSMPPPSLPPIRPSSRLPGTPQPMSTAARLAGNITPNVRHSPYTSQQQHRCISIQPNATNPTSSSRLESMLDWTSADFELSTQDCREIGVE